MTEKIFVATAMVGWIGGTIIALFSLNLLHLILHRRLKKLLLRQPYYSPGEIGFFSVWPFSTVVTTAYIELITVPAIPKFKRFVGFNDPLPTNILFTILCWLMLSFTVIAIISVVALGVWALY